MTYKDILKSNQKRLLNLFNLDTFSSTIGFGDRKYWAWKTIDFPNATFQSGVKSLAISVKLDIALDKNLYLEIIDKVIFAIPNIRNKNKSFNEAFPNENSYCVTALVIYDILFCIDLLKDHINQHKIEKYFSIVEPSINYLINNEEKHAIISNHLATAAAALCLWQELTGKHKNSYKKIIDKIIINQSDEGWYKEYEGPDPGYQTLCLQYLSTIIKKTNDKKLKISLQKSFKFLYYLIHPDGTTGGLYGSRNTEVVYPGGLSLLRNISDHSSLCFHFLSKGIFNGFSLLPQDIDSDNYIPLLNSFASAALNEKNISRNKNKLKPFFVLSGKKHFKDSGIEVFSNDNYYSILNYKKGGTLLVYDILSKKCVYESGGIFLIKSGKKYSTQIFDKSVIKNEDGTFISSLYNNNEKYPSHFQTVLIRLLSISFFKIPSVVEIFKKVIVKMLITRKSRTNIRIKTFVDYKKHNIHITHNFLQDIGECNLYVGKKFKSIHMASSGYFTKKLVYNSTKSIVKEQTNFLKTI